MLSINTDTHTDFHFHSIYIFKYMTNNNGLSMQPWRVPTLLIYIHADNFLYIDINVDMNLHELLNM